MRKTNKILAIAIIVVFLFNFSGYKHQNVDKPIKNELDIREIKGGAGQNGII